MAMMMTWGASGGVEGQFMAKVTTDSFKGLVLEKPMTYEYFVFFLSTYLLAEMLLLIFLGLTLIGLIIASCCKKRIRAID